MNATETMQLWASVIAETAGKEDDKSFFRRNEAMTKMQQWAVVAQVEQLKRIADALEKMTGVVDGDYVRTHEIEW